MTIHLCTRRGLRAVIAALWLIAGALQLQPFMFTSGFAQDVLGSAGLSQPAPVAALVSTAERMVQAHPAPWNWLFALAELVIGLGMLIGRTGLVARVACGASVGFGLGVWVIGEGLGGLFTGRAALSTGAPGAALLYSALTVAAWPRALRSEVGTELPLPRRGLHTLWTAVWLLGAALALVPAQWGPNGLGAQAAMGWMMSPRWTTGTTHAVATWLATLDAPVASLVNSAMVVGYVAIALGVRRSLPTERAFLVVGALLAVIYWVFAQGFGGLSTGTATDVGSAPLIVVLAVAVFASSVGPDPVKSTRAARLQLDNIAGK